MSSKPCQPTRAAPGCTVWVWLRSQSSFCHFHAQTCFRRVSTMGRLRRPGSQQGPHRGEGTSPWPSRALVLLQEHGLRAQTPSAGVTALAPGSPGTWAPLSCQHQHPNSGSGGVPSTATATPSAGTALPWDTAFVHSIQPHHTSAQPRRKGLGTTHGREQEPALSTLLAAPTAHHSTSSEGLCPGTRGLSTRTHGGHPLAAGSPRRRTWMRSRMPSSLSEESTQKTK